MLFVSCFLVRIALFLCLLCLDSVKIKRTGEVEISSVFLMIWIVNGFPWNCGTFSECAGILAGFRMRNLIAIS